MTSWRRGCWAFFALAAGLACGCLQGEPSLEFDSELARQALITALDAWKDGKQRRLARLEPPIRFADEDENDGSRLLEYELTEPDLAVRPYEDVPVELLLRDSGGKRVTRSVSYQVTLQPRLAVLRSDP